MKENIDENINRYNSEVDAEEIWAAIEPRVDEINDKKKKKRRGLFFLFGTLGFMLLVFTAYYATNVSSIQEKSKLTSQRKSNVDQSLNQDKLDRNKQIKNQEEPAQQNIKSKIDQQNQTKIAELSKHSVETKNPNSTSTLPESSSELTEKQTTNAVTTSQVMMTSGSTSSKKESSKVSDSKYPKVVSDNGNRDSHRLERASMDKEQNSSTSSNAADKNTSKNAELTREQSIAHQVANGSAHQEQGQAANHTESDNLVKKEAENQLVSEVDLIKIKPIIVASQALVYNNTVAVVERRSTLAPKSKSLSFSLGINSGAFALNRILDETSSNGSGYRSVRLNTETPLEAIQYGLEMGIQHKSGFNFSIGYQRVDINERFDSRHMIIDTTWVNDVEFLVVNLMQDTVKVYGEIPEINTMTKTYEIYNRYRLVEIPITLGYQHELNKWKLGAHVGLLTNISLAAKGRIFNMAGDVIKLDDENDRYRDRINLGYQFGLSIERPIIGKLSFKLAPSVKFYPNFLSGSQSLTKKYTLLGGQAGLSYRFN